MATRASAVARCLEGGDEVCVVAEQDDFRDVGNRCCSVGSHIVVVLTNSEYAHVIHGIKTASKKSSPHYQS